MTNNKIFQTVLAERIQQFIDATLGSPQRHADSLLTDEQREQLLDNGQVQKAALA
jgi:hypothetical protein